jgi:TetR/AcrR family transcriptional regulator, repressor of fatR-cypB operon
LKLRDDNKSHLIFQSALGLVKEKGLAGITMSEIARNAGMATGTLYIYFSCKEQLINTIFAECRKASVENYFRNYDASLPFKSGFTTVWMNMLQFRIENFDEVVFMEQCYHSPFLNACTKQLTEQMTRPLYQLIERGKEENVFKALDTFTLLVFMIGSIHEGVKKAHYSRQPLEKKAIQDMFTLCWDGMKK